MSTAARWPSPKTALVLLYSTSWPPPKRCSPSRTRMPPMPDTSWTPRPLRDVHGRVRQGPVRVATDSFCNDSTGGVVYRGDVLADGITGPSVEWTSPALVPEGNDH